MTSTGPVADQPVRSPVSNPPFTRPFLVTVTTTLVECVIDPAMPVTVTVYWPGATPKPAPMVRIPTPPAVMYGWLSDSVGPAGDTLADGLMLSTPLIAVVSIATWTLDPCATATADGSAAIVKSGTEKTWIDISA